MDFLEYAIYLHIFFLGLQCQAALDSMENPGLLNITSLIISFLNSNMLTLSHFQEDSIIETTAGHPVAYIIRLIDFQNFFSSFFLLIVNQSDIPKVFVE